MTLRPVRVVVVSSLATVRGATANPARSTYLLGAREFGVGEERLNPRGGAIALGHPLGASGTRLLTPMLHAIEDNDATFGLQTMCEAGGMANATIIERM